MRSLSRMRMRYHSGQSRTCRGPVYSLVRSLLFALDPERSHDLALGLLRCAWRVPGVSAARRLPDAPQQAESQIVAAFRVEREQQGADQGIHGASAGA